MSGKIGIITGGTGFLGQLFADALAELGMTVVITDIDQNACQSAASRVRKRRKVDAMGIAADLADPDSPGQLIDEVVSHFGRIDVLINNAQAKPLLAYVPFADLSLEDWNQTIGINLTAAFRLCQAAEKPLKRRGGSVVNMSSIYGLVAPDMRIYQDMKFNTPITYSVTKSAVYGFTKYLAVYWAAFGIRVNAITPGGVYNGHEEKFERAYSHRVPLGRMAKREELRGAMQYLVSNASTYVTGQNIVVDGGLTIW